MKRVLTAAAVAVAVTLTAPLMARQRLVLVLDIAEAPPAASNGQLTVKLASGATVTVPVADVNMRKSFALNEEVVGRRSASPPTSTRAKCAKEWPDDFSMRAFCEKQEHEAASKLHARSMTTRDQRVIRTTCEREWPDDLNMRNFCEEQQLKALGTLNSSRPYGW
jgi:hypothetical protein